MASQQTFTFDNCVQRRQLNNPCNGVPITTVQTLQGDVTVNQIRTPWLADDLQKRTLLGCHRQVRRTVKAAKRCCELLYNSGALFKMCNRSQIKEDCDLRNCE